MAPAPKSKVRLLVERDICSIVVALAGLATLVWEPYVVLPIMIVAFLYFRRVRTALQNHPEPLSPREKRSVFVFHCALIVLFLGAILTYALTAHSQLVWIIFAGYLLIAPAALYFAHLDVQADRT